MGGTRRTSAAATRARWRWGLACLAVAGSGRCPRSPFERDDLDRGRNRRSGRHRRRRPCARGGDQPAPRGVGHGGRALCLGGAVLTPRPDRRPARRDQDARGHGGGGVLGRRWPGDCSEAELRPHRCTDRGQGLPARRLLEQQDSEVSAAGVISTVAGNGEKGFGGDGGPATNALLNHPRSVAALSPGSFLIPDTTTASAGVRERRDHHRRRHRPPGLRRRRRTGDCRAALVPVRRCAHSGRRLMGCRQPAHPRSDRRRDHHHGRRQRRREVQR